MAVNQKSDNNVFNITDVNMNFWQKIFWRLKILLVESWGKNWKAILFSLLPAKKRNAVALSDFLNRRGIIKINKSEKYFMYKDFIFYYNKDTDISSLVADFVSIWGKDADYLRRNFFNSSAYFFEGPYEERGVKIKKGDSVIDAGANIGLFSVLASKKTGAEGKIFSFEPIENSAKILEKNILNNNIKNANIIKQALGEKNCEKEFTVLENSAENTGYFQGDYPKETVKVTILDDFVAENNLSKVDFIKADVEGMERELVRGAEKTIKRFKPNLAICVYHRPDDPEILQGLIKNFVPEYNFYLTKTKLYAWL